jgi:hypothetical protein
VQSRPSNSFTVVEYTEDSIAALFPLAYPAFDQRHPFGARQRFKLDPSHPRPQMVHTLGDSDAELFGFVVPPLPKDQPRCLYRLRE